MTQVDLLSPAQTVPEPARAGRDIIALQGVSKRYAGAAQLALQPTSLSIREGEFFSILGPSGSGKTTTLRLIAGFEKPDSGAVYLGSADVTNVPPDKRDVNTVFQNYALFPHLTIAENVGFPLVMKKLGSAEIAQRVKEAIGLVEMTGFGARLPHQLSGGQRQRIALARALVGRPKVLLLDEPLGALDLRLRQQMQHALTSLQEQLGITFVYVTHDQGEALSMSDRVAVMSNGQVEQIGTPEDLYYAPKNEFIARFVGKSNLLDADITMIDGGLTAGVAGVHVPLAQAARTGKAKLAIRCDTVSLSSGPGEPALQAVPGVVRNVLFLGTTLEVAVNCQGTELIAVVPARRERDVKAGDRVFCNFNPLDVVVLHD
ncbi:ABC transporter ATP-binding protein [Pararhizobium sp.]|uniref:ABC transporter ATP-binding protein n=1 Tax=Pararhizobium sp. TaxID=1977563 RepID=UPI002728B2AF|nr:ABC transporter ATP-binding protein [Pararhizobium sp.]MDO9418053.1 ABC transporter ATP-binding protein [Pararhizobium sp.]